MTNSPHHPPIHPRGSFNWAVALIAILLGLAWAIYEIWDRHVPSDEWLLSEAERRMAALVGVGSGITCFRLQPIRAEEQQSADAWVGCRHAGSTPGKGNVFHWYDRLEGRRGLFGGRIEVEIEGSNLWNR